MSVLGHLNDVASNLNLADKESENINRSIEALSGRLTAHFAQEIKQKLRFGSSTRSTMLPREADPQSDVDYLIVFDNTNGLKPQTFLRKLRDFADTHYRHSVVNQSHPAVVLRLNHIQFDLVPAYRPSWGYWDGDPHIPAPSSSFQEWMSTDPLSLNQPLYEKNKLHGHMIKPLIRLLKYWNAQNGYVYESFALERHLAQSYYSSGRNLKEHIYAAVDNLPTASLPSYKLEKVLRLRAKIREVQTLEAQGLPISAELEIARVFPPLD